MNEATTESKSETEMPKSAATKAAKPAQTAKSGKSSKPANANGDAKADAKADTKAEPEDTSPPIFAKHGKKTVTETISPYDLVIVGGKDYLKGDEGSPNDVADDEDDPLCETKRLKESLDDEFVLNFEEFGQLQNVVAVYRDGKPYTVVGRRRIRAARKISKRRTKRGEPVMMLQVTIVDSLEDLAGIMDSENEGRVGNEMAAKIAKVKRYIARHYTPERIAVIFGVKESTIKVWLRFDEHATKETKRALADDKLAPTAAMKIATISDPKEQNSALEQVIATPGKKTAAKAAKLAKKAASHRKGVKKGTPVTAVKTIKSMKTLAESVVKTDEKDEDYWSVVVEVLAYIAGDRSNQKLVDVIGLAE